MIHDLMADGRVAYVYRAFFVCNQYLFTSVYSTGFFEKYHKNHNKTQRNTYVIIIITNKHASRMSFQISLSVNVGYYCLRPSSHRCQVNHLFICICNLHNPPFHRFLRDGFMQKLGYVTILKLLVVGVVSTQSLSLSLSLMYHDVLPHHPPTHPHPHTPSVPYIQYRNYSGCWRNSFDCDIEHVLDNNNKRST
jgi:hypothetical protein